MLVQKPQNSTGPFFCIREIDALVRWTGLQLFHLTPVQVLAHRIVPCIRRIKPVKSANTKWAYPSTGARVTGVGADLFSPAKSVLRFVGRDALH